MSASSFAGMPGIVQPKTSSTPIVPAKAATAATITNVPKDTSSSQQASEASGSIRVSEEACTAFAPKAVYGPDGMVHIVYLKCGATGYNVYYRSMPSSRDVVMSGEELQVIDGSTVSVEGSLEGVLAGDVLTVVDGPVSGTYEIAGVARSSSKWICRLKSQLPPDSFAFSITRDKSELVIEQSASVKNDDACVMAVADSKIRYPDVVFSSSETHVVAISSEQVLDDVRAGSKLSIHSLSGASGNVFDVIRVLVNNKKVRSCTGGTRKSNEYIVTITAQSMGNEMSGTRPWSIRRVIGNTDMLVASGADLRLTNRQTAVMTGVSFNDVQTNQALEIFSGYAKGVYRIKSVDKAKSTLSWTDDIFPDIPKARYIVTGKSALSGSATPEIMISKIATSGPSVSYTMTVLTSSGLSMSAGSPIVVYNDEPSLASSGLKQRDLLKVLTGRNAGTYVIENQIDTKSFSISPAPPSTTSNDAFFITREVTGDNIQVVSSFSTFYNYSTSSEFSGAVESSYSGTREEYVKNYMMWDGFYGWNETSWYFDYSGAENVSGAKTSYPASATDDNCGCPFGNADLAGPTNVYYSPAVIQPGHAYHPDVAVGSDGEVHIVWMDSRNGEFEIYYAAKSKSWSNFRITNFTGNSSYPSVCVTVDNIVYVVWQDSRNGGWDIYYCTRSSSGAWSSSANSGTDTRLTAMAGDSKFPDVVAGPDGRVHMVFQMDVDGKPEIFYSRTL
jgi:hypothetical protein